MKRGRPWRYLRTGEVVREGDQFHEMFTEWIPARATVGHTLTLADEAQKLWRTRRP